MAPHIQLLMSFQFHIWPMMWFNGFDCEYCVLCSVFISIRWMDASTTNERTNIQPNYVNRLLWMWEQCLSEKKKIDINSDSTLFGLFLCHCSQHRWSLVRVLSRLIAEMNSTFPHCNASNNALTATERQWTVVRERGEVADANGIILTNLFGHKWKRSSVFGIIRMCVLCSGLNATQCVGVYWDLFDTINTHTHTEALLALTFSQFAALCDHIYVKLIIMFATATKHLAVSDVRKRTCAKHAFRDGERDRDWRRGSHMILVIIVATSQTLKRRQTHRNQIHSLLFHTSSLARY